MGPRGYLGWNGKVRKCWKEKERRLEWKGGVDLFRLLSNN